MSTSASKRSAAFACVLLTGGCSLAPRYTRPVVAAPAAYAETPIVERSPDGTVWAPAAPRDGETRGAWWTLFGDPELDGYEKSLDDSNQSVASAAAAFLAARAGVALARSQYAPTLGVAPGVSRSRISTNPSGQATSATFSEYTLPFDASWQPDFWGKTRSAVEASVFAAQASAADLENVRLSAHAELAVDYYQLRAQDALEVLLDSAAAADLVALDMSRARNKAGLDSDQTVSLAQSQLGSAQALASNAGILRAQYLHAIATLLGVTPSSFAITPAPFQAPSPAFPLGVPSILLERRPDIAAAERAVAQANARIGVARAAYFPIVTLSASAGFESLSPATWLTWPSRFWSVGANASEILFDGGARGATVRQSEAVYAGTVADYRQTVLSAFQQVEDALASVRISAQDALGQDAAVDAARRNESEARARYGSGLVSYVDVVTAQTARLTLEQTALAFRVQQVVARVRLIEALGGGWDDANLPKSKELNR
jgi:NodT family efflux transporter outer membrane factor (OMF) lipoprotein